MIRLLFLFIIFLPFLGNAQISDPNFAGWEGNPWGQRFSTTKKLYAAAEPPTQFDFESQEKLIAPYENWQATFSFQFQGLKQVELSRSFPTAAISEGYNLFETLREKLDSLFPDQPLLASTWRQYKKEVVGQHSVISLTYKNTDSRGELWVLTLTYAEKLATADEIPDMSLPKD